MCMHTGFGYPESEDLLSGLEIERVENGRRRGIEQGVRSRAQNVDLTVLPEAPVESEGKR